MLWMFPSKALRRSYVLNTLLKDTQYIRQGERDAEALDKHLAGMENLRLPDTLSTDFLMKDLWRSILRVIVKLAAFSSF